MEDSVTFLDSILANSSYFDRVTATTRTLGFTGMVKVVLLRFGVMKRITLKYKGKLFYLTMQNFQDFWRDEISTYNGTRIKFVGDEARFLYKGKWVIFKINENKRVQAQTGLLINEQFFSEQYSFTEIKDRQVVDIGANIGDSPIYFALNGARAVYAYEPFPYIYDRAKKNIAANHLNKKIAMNNEAVGGRDSYVSFPSNYIDGSGSMRNIKQVSSMKKVHVTTLDTVVKKYKIRNALLKSDCEGEEYDIFLNANDKTLGAFDDIIIEYHYGYLKLKKRLEKAGFDVEVRRPVKMLHADGSKSSYAGIMRAIRQTA